MTTEYYDPYAGDIPYAEPWTGYVPAPAPEPWYGPLADIFTSTVPFAASAYETYLQAQATQTPDAIIYQAPPYGQPPSPTQIFAPGPTAPAPAPVIMPAVPKAGISPALIIGAVAILFFMRGKK
ncbi:MAG: hypothetical protein HWN68_16615 [Desulfobacterales bacterium]|nr:hypothetical protein [Desulfobacterales bacterium]